MKSHVGQIKMLDIFDKNILKSAVGKEQLHLISEENIYIYQIPHFVKIAPLFCLEAQIQL